MEDGSDAVESNAYSRSIAFADLRAALNQQGFDVAPYD